MGEGDGCGDGEGEGDGFVGLGDGEGTGRGVGEGVGEGDGVGDGCGGIVGEGDGAWATGPCEPPTAAYAPAELSVTNATASMFVIVFERSHGLRIDIISSLLAG